MDRRIVADCPLIFKYELDKDKTPSFVKMFFLEVNWGTVIGFCLGILLQYYDRSYYREHYTYLEYIIDHVLPIFGALLILNTVIAVILYISARRKYKK